MSFQNVQIIENAINVLDTQRAVLRGRLQESDLGGGLPLIDFYERSKINRDLQTVEKRLARYEAMLTA